MILTFTKAAIDADVTMHLANADHLPAVKALIKGLLTGGKRRIYINSSGTGELIDESKESILRKKFITILTLKLFILSQQINLIDMSTLTYLATIKGFESIIVAPPTIYRLGTGPFRCVSEAAQGG